MTTQSFQCWSCGQPRAATDALCPGCGKVQPPAALTQKRSADGSADPVLDKFAVLGFPRAFDMHPAKLEEAFKSLSRKLHPDRFARAGAEERRFSLEQTTLLNDAYRTLKDPVRRAEHLLELRGVAVGEGSKVEMAPEFLEQAMDDREQLLAAKADGGPQAVELLAQGVRAKRDLAMTQIAQQLRALEGGTQASLGPVTELLARLRYYARYLDEALGHAAEI